MKERYVFDLDNTLVMTDELNNAAYNHALVQHGLNPIPSRKRLTRKEVFSHYSFLSEKEQHEIIEAKQMYVQTHLSSALLNTALVDRLRGLKKEHCLLWTSADRRRAEALLQHYRLEDCFISVLYSKKDTVEEDIPAVCSQLHCEKEALVFFEDDPIVLCELKRLGQRCIQPDRT